MGIRLQLGLTVAAAALDALFACRYGAARRVRLGSDGECQGTSRASKPRLAGRYVGWVSTSCNLDASEEQARVFDLRAGRLKAASAAATGDFNTAERDVTTFIR